MWIQAKSQRGKTLKQKASMGEAFPPSTFHSLGLCLKPLLRKGKSRKEKGCFTKPTLCVG